MAEITANEKKVRSIRADEETFNRFKEICEQAGGQQEALTALISNFELNQAKSTLPGQTTVIDDFKARIEGIMRAYINALELSANAEERIREEFRLHIDTQTKTIANLQTRNDRIKAELDTTKLTLEEISSAKATEISELKTAYNAASDRATTADKQREQAEQIANMATEQVQSLKAQIKELTAKAEQSDSYKVKSEQATVELERLKEQLRVEQENKENELETARREKETAVKLAIAETREKYQDKIEELQREHAKQISELLAQQNKMAITKKTERR